MSDVDPTVDEARRWLRFAEEDLKAAHILMSAAEPSSRHACWLSQQAAEKSLKAGLILESIAFPFTHDLDVLRNLLPSGWSVKETHSDLADLTEWAVEGRYPGDWQEPTLDDAIRAESAATLVYELISSEMTRRGLTPN